MAREARKRKREKEREKEREREAPAVTAEREAVAARSSAHRALSLCKVHSLRPSILASC